MAHIHGSAVHSSITRASARRKDILLRLVLPLLFVLMLAAAGLYAFNQNQPWITAFFAVFFIAAILRFEELGLTLSHYLSHSQTNARAAQIVNKALRQLPDEYHVFHNLHFEGTQLDHAVIGPNGLFLIKTRSHLGNITATGESLRLNGWPFLLDMLTHCWNQTQKLTKHLDLQYTGGVRPCPVLCFSRASVGITGPVRAALVVEAGNLVQAILAHDDPLPADKIHVLIEKLSALVSSQTGPRLSATGGLHNDSDMSRPQPNSNRPICTRCGHQPSLEEFELFSGECPKCGRLYSFIPDESEAAPADQPHKILWKPSIPQLAVTVLLIAGYTGYIAHRQGLLRMEHMFIQTGQTAGAEPEASVAPAPAARNAADSPAPMVGQPKNSGNHTSPALKDILPSVEASRADAIEGEPASPVFSQSNDDAASTPEPEPEANSSATAAAHLDVNATSPDTDAHSGEKHQDAPSPTATLPKPKAEVAGKSLPQSTKESFDQGRLVVTSPRPLVLWFKNQQTCKEFGPFEIKGKSVRDIVLPKGFYSVVYLESGKRRHTTMSFLSDQGQLDF
ncbi:nuclease-related domain-containing protein [Desulfomicrobium baculatum]|uniref:NERD domain protein n=1 Tax=Desulfomicrobium baculatum (strain DSM 4028 / VKM B-1378 / X) TaxID=525897 RepID=C7LPD5_DESBD|nr:NERD domain-containing protein [Desulfomicrobium baculatum]ACU88978.1 NERD domain protein [Desulfomicrobium baculatum DSM 4028]